MSLQARLSEAEQRAREERLMADVARLEKQIQSAEARLLRAQELQSVYESYLRNLDR